MGCPQVGAPAGARTLALDLARVLLVFVCRRAVRRNAAHDGPSGPAHPLARWTVRKRHTPGRMGPTSRSMRAARRRSSAPEPVAPFVGGLLGLRRSADGPPDQVEKRCDGDLQDHHQEHQRDPRLHQRGSLPGHGGPSGRSPTLVDRRLAVGLIQRGSRPSRTQALSASTWPSSRPSCDSVGTSRVGSGRAAAQA